MKKRLSAHPDRCRDCQACVLACSLVFEDRCSPYLARLRIDKDMHKYEFGMTICRHCDTPACEAACPTAAISVDGRDVAILDDGECTRCGACAQACPHEALFYSSAADRYLKCDLCVGRADGPVCVQVCPVQALEVVRVTGRGEE